MIKTEQIGPVVLSGSEMRAVEDYTIKSLGIAGLQLMENAGAAAARILIDTYPLIGTETVAIICGSGNNCGDGFIVARILRQAGKQVTVFFVGDDLKQSDDAKEARRKLEASGVKVENRGPNRAVLSRASILVDALFGTGFRGPLCDDAAAAVISMNEARRPIVSLDIPSGLSADSFKIPDVYVNATETIAFAFAKHAQVVEPIKSLMGHLVVVDIGIPAEALKCLSRPATLLTDRTIPSHLLERKAHSHKGNYGHVLVIGGSRGMCGAPILAAQAALHAGAGLVTVVLAAAEFDVLPCISPEIMILRLIDQRGYFCSEHLSVIQQAIAVKKISAVVLGMGLGAEAETMEFTRGVLAMTELPIVLDADGLRALDLSSGAKLNRNIIVTPHAGEYRHGPLGDGQLLEEGDQPILRLRNRAIAEGLTIVHKASTTLVADPEGSVFINTSGNPGMATGGMGDTLAGIIGAFCAQGIPLSDAASLGVYLHGRAGDLCAEEFGEIAVTASAVALWVGRALRLSRQNVLMGGL